MKIIEDHPTVSLFGFSAIWVILLLVLPILCSSCNTQEKYNRKTLKHKDWLSQLCANTFPIDTTSVQENADTTEADNIDHSKIIDSLQKVAENALKSVKRDTIYSEKECNSIVQRMHITINSLTKAINKLRDEYKPCKPSYITRTITITKEGTARLYEANLKIEGLEKEVGRKASQRNWLFGFLLIAVAIIFIVKK